MPTVRMCCLVLRTEPKNKAQSHKDHCPSLRGAGKFFLISALSPGKRRTCSWRATTEEGIFLKGRKDLGRWRRRVVCRGDIKDRMEGHRGAREINGLRVWGKVVCPWREWTLVLERHKGETKIPWKAEGAKEVMWGNSRWMAFSFSKIMQDNVRVGSGVRLQGDAKLLGVSLWGMWQSHPNMAMSFQKHKRPGDWMMLPCIKFREAWQHPQDRMARKAASTWAVFTTAFLV